MQIKLTPHECYISGLVGYRRNLEAILQGRQARFKEKVPGELYGFHILAAQAEMVVAKALNVFWSPHINHFEHGDVGKIEVRYSQRQDVKVRQRDTGIVVGVSGFTPDFFVRGFVQAEWAQKNIEPSAPRPGPPAFFVPWDRLTPIEMLLNNLQEAV